MQADSRTYLVLNLVGSAVLAGLALHEEQWGFLLLEGVGDGLRLEPGLGRAGLPVARGQPLATSGQALGVERSIRRRARPVRAASSAATGEVSPDRPSTR